MAAGGIIGSEWSDVVPVSDTWTAASASTNTWTPITASSDTWYSNRLQDPYVEIDYWENGYTTDRYEFWAVSSVSSNNWVRQ